MRRTPVHVKSEHVISKKPWSCSTGALNLWKWYFQGFARFLTLQYTVSSFIWRLHYEKQDTIVEDNFVFSCSSICSRPRDYSQTILHLWLNIHCEIMNDSKDNTPKSTYRTAENVEIVISSGNQMKRILEFCKYHDFSSIKLHPPKSVHVGVEGCSSFRKTQREREGVNSKKEHKRIRSSPWAPMNAAEWLRCLLPSWWTSSMLSSAMPEDHWRQGNRLHQSWQRFVDQIAFFGNLEEDSSLSSHSIIEKHPVWLSWAGLAPGGGSWLWAWHPGGRLRYSICAVFCNGLLQEVLEELSSCSQLSEFLLAGSWTETVAASGRGFGRQSATHCYHQRLWHGGRTGER